MRNMVQSGKKKRGDGAPRVEEQLLKRYGLWGLAVCLALLLCALPAFAETARVVTPGGKVNVRKAANEKSRLVTSVPNKTLVEVVEAGETWSKITYKKQTGYMKTEFLKLPSQLPGKKVYADEGTLLLRKTAAADAAIVALAGPQNAVTVESVEGAWAKVKYGKASGYVPVEQLSYQRDKASGSASWISETGTVSKACKVRLTADASSKAVASLAAGEKVTVALLDGKNCLVQAGEVWGYAPKAGIVLTGAEDTEEKAGSISHAEAASAATAALKQRYKAFAKGRFYYTVAVCKTKDGVKGPFYHCAFYDDQDQYLYGALVNAKTGKAVFTGDYSGFAAPKKAAEQLLPAGEVKVTLSAETLKIGDVLDITVEAWTRKACQYTLKKDGKQVVSTAEGQHFTAAYRPKEAGEYELSVTVKDEKKQKKTVQAAFTVTEQKNSAQPAVYSQKDGWWKTVAYRKSNMDHSGCAIFALSHALHRMGYTGSQTLPQSLAKKYAMCLTPEGTNNEWLIRVAAADFGFTTQRLLIKDEKEIVKLLRAGTLFSFSVARGHIAMISGVSEDGEMVRVVDSAPLATFERIVNASMCYQLRSGSFRAALSMDDLPSARWYLDTDEYGGLEYWLPVSYAAKRGVRVIQPSNAKQEK